MLSQDGDNDASQGHEHHDGVDGVRRLVSHPQSDRPFNKLNNGIGNLIVLVTGAGEPA
jgi:hypothetical protein